MILLKKLLLKAISSKLENDARVFYASLYEQTFLKIYPIVKSYFPRSADDITASVYSDKLLSISLLQYLDVIDYLIPFVRKITRNYCNTEYQKRKKRNDLANSSFFEEFISTHDRGHMNSMNLSMDLRRAIDSLPEKQRVAFCLFAIYGFKYKEIAAETDNSLDAIRQLIRRARKNLQKMLS